MQDDEKMNEMMLDLDWPLGFVKCREKVWGFWVFSVRECLWEKSLRENKWEKWETLCEWKWVGGVGWGRVMVLGTVTLDCQTLYLLKRTAARLSINLQLWIFLVVLQMSPKTGTKRKSSASTSGTIDRPIPPPRNFDRTRFSSGRHFERFTKFDKGTWHDKVFNINLDGPYAHILEMITSRKWDKLLTPHPH